MEQKVARLIECERIVRQTQAEQLRLIAELNTDEWFATELGLALQLSPANARYLVEWASNVAKLFPDVLDALEAGVISERSAHAIVAPAEGGREAPGAPPRPVPPTTAPPHPSPPAPPGPRRPRPPPRTTPPRPQSRPVR